MNIEPDEPPADGPLPEARPTTADRLLACCRFCNASLLLLVSVFLFLAPGFIVIHDLLDPLLYAGGIPASAWRLHRSLTPKYERWARARMDSTRPYELAISNISGTEWPLF